MTVYNPQFTQLSDGNGDPLIGGKKSFYLAGTATPADTYTNNGFATKHPNPVIADSRGIWPPIHFNAGAYKCITTDQSDNVIFTEDNIASADIYTDVQAQIDALASRMDDAEANQATTGDVILSVRTTPPTGWILLDAVLPDYGTIGDATSGATIRANIDCEDLFVLVWNSLSDYGVLNSSGVATARGATAEADWAAHYRIRAPVVSGRALVGTGAGYLLTSRALGDTWGAEVHTLSTDEMPVHAHSMAGRQGAGDMDVTWNDKVGGETEFHADQFSFGDTKNTGGGASHTNTQPSIALNVLMKL